MGENLELAVCGLNGGMGGMVTDGNSTVRLKGEIEILCHRHGSL